MNNPLLYRALADETRRRIIEILLRYGLCVSALARQLNISESAVSQHLKLLRKAGLLHGEKRGYYMHYDIDREKLHALARDIETMAGIPRQKNDEPSRQTEARPCSEEKRRLCHGRTGRTILPMAPLPERKH